MDTTKEYVLMCEKAIEIQKKSWWLVGDFIASHSDNHGIENLGCISQQNGHIFAQKYSKHPFGDKVGVLSCMITIPKSGHDDLYIWLPRQDQLQDMISWDKRMTAREIIETFSVFIGFERADYYNKFTSMEQLWLAFVMYDIWNKKWNGKDWIKINK